MTDSAPSYRVGSGLMEQTIQALDNASTTLGRIIEGHKPVDPLDAYREAVDAYEALCAVVAEQIAGEDG